MARTTEALRDFQAIAPGAGAGRIVAVATAAMRDATRPQRDAVGAIVAIWLVKDLDRRFERAFGRSLIVRH